MANPEGSAIYFSVDGVDQTIRDMVFEHGMSNGHAISKQRRRHLISADHSFVRHIRRYGRFLLYHNHIFHKPVEAIKDSDIHPAVVRYSEQVNAAMKGQGYAEYYQTPDVPKILSALLEKSNSKTNIPVVYLSV